MEWGAVESAQAAPHREAARGTAGERLERTVDADGARPALPLPGSATAWPACSSHRAVPCRQEAGSGRGTEAAWSGLGDRHWKTRRALEGWPLHSKQKSPMHRANSAETWGAGHRPAGGRRLSGTEQSPAMTGAVGPGSSAVRRLGTEARGTAPPCLLRSPGLGAQGGHTGHPLPSAL